MMLRAAVFACVTAFPVVAQEITAAEFSVPTDAYPHGVLGDDLEWKTLSFTVRSSKGKEGGLFHAYIDKTYKFELETQTVFEDLAPRLWDLTGDGSPEVIVVQSHQQQGARLQVWGLVEGVPELIAATPFIGTRFRWLAPLGAADFNGDGFIDIAYVDRPHLTKMLRVWSFVPPKGFVEVGTLRGISNHRIGEDFITGGVRDCGEGPEMVALDAAWQWIMAARLSEVDFTAKRIARFQGQASVKAALDCN